MNEGLTSHDLKQRRAAALAEIDELHAKRGPLAEKILAGDKKAAEQDRHIAGEQQARQHQVETIDRALGSVTIREAEEREARNREIAKENRTQFLTLQYEVPQHSKKADEHLRLAMAEITERDRKLQLMEGYFHAQEVSSWRTHYGAVLQALVHAGFRIPASVGPAESLYSNDSNRLNYKEHNLK